MKKQTIFTPEFSEALKFINELPQHPQFKLVLERSGLKFGYSGVQADFCIWKTNRESVNSWFSMAVYNMQDAKTFANELYKFLKFHNYFLTWGLDNDGVTPRNPNQKKK